jgi:hypothetical protein
MILAVAVAVETGVVAAGYLLAKGKRERQAPCWQTLSKLLPAPFALKQETRAVTIGSTSLESALNVS